MNKESAYEELELDDAFRVKEALSSVSSFETCSTTVYSGYHEQHGWIHLVFPPMGSCVLIKPFASI